MHRFTISKTSKTLAKLFRAERVFDFNTHTHTHTQNHFGSYSTDIRNHRRQDGKREIMPEILRRL